MYLSDLIEGITFLVKKHDGRGPKLDIQ